MLSLSSRIGSNTCLDASSCTYSSLSLSSLVCVNPLIIERICQRNLCPVGKFSTNAAKITPTTVNPILDDSSDANNRQSQSRSSADWKAARAYKESGFIYEGKIQGFNGGGLLVRFFSLVGFLPFPQMSPSHSCKEPQKSIHEIAKGLTGSIISVKVIQANEEMKKLVFSEKDAVWNKYSSRVNVEDIFVGRVGSVEDYGAFIHLRFPDGLYHLTGLVHVSEVSWDLIQDIRDILNEGDEVRVKVIKIDREKSRITLSIKQLEEDPLLETLEKVIPQDGSVISDSSSMSSSNSNTIEPLPGLGAIFEELLQEDGIDDVRITRQGFEKRVVSQDLQLWLSNAPPSGKKFTLLARAGRQVQEIQLSTFLDQEGIKKALQRVLERVP
ncbi:hypothetical protein KPL70_025992 [Citrus sinensis]|uniref:S1 motif domain-containing protein n=3 Tax=Citrus clementina TaxID=85681 RepID=V4S656_CITCL|nr:uncharacterized protein LOC18032136 isoform X1 [Citrus x clementina]XP_006492976.2 uncharacterized protein LOC102616265 isoform X1 [Citrus sinensis]ESR34305.1 hypothetical protein CICLE_v10005159mg [Citrus x clementina]KAH9649443.1 hypothetical protein KPL70_025992 [Citrus sinensis]